jgi:hypothetical protein
MKPIGPDGSDTVLTQRSTSARSNIRDCAGHFALVAGDEPKAEGRQRDRV